MLPISLLLAPFLLVGCAPLAEKYAREARSGYIGARAVLAEVKEFTSSMEELLRSTDPESLPSRGRDLIEEARDLLSEAYAAFRTAREKADRLREAGGENYAAYADALRELVDMNLQVLASYSELIGLSGTALEGFPYTENPSYLMPTLNRMDELADRIQELTSRIAPAEVEAEALYRALEE